MNEVEVVGRKCEPSVQVVDLHSVILAIAPSRPRVPGVRGNYGNECHLTEDSWALVITSRRLLTEMEGKKEMVHSLGATSYQAHRLGSCAGQYLRQ